jgi:hypothetical protein
VQPDPFERLQRDLSGALSTTWSSLPPLTACEGRGMSMAAHALALAEPSSAATDNRTVRSI